MKKSIGILLFCLILAASMVGCSHQEPAPTQSSSQTTYIGNPWSTWESIQEAETAAGMSFGLPEVIADSYTAAAFRTMNQELIEVIYRDADFEVRVRKQIGEGLDLSGDYNSYAGCTEEQIKGGTVLHYSNADDAAVKILISYEGFSWSLTASEGFRGDAGSAFLDLIFSE